MKLDNKVVMITGASKGIGRTTAHRLAKEGVKLVLIARDMVQLRIVESELREYNIDVMIIAADTSHRDQIRKAVEGTINKLGRIDILICCAGQYYRSSIAELSMEDVERMMDVNFYGTLNCIYEVMPHMTENRSGQVVVVSSVDGKKGLPLDGAYVASKFALSGFMDVLRQETRGTGITVTTVFPGRVDTPLISDLKVPWISAKIPPERAARAIYRAILRKKGEVFVPYFTSKLLVVLSGVSYKLGDFIIRIFKLEGK